MNRTKELEALATTDDTAVSDKAAPRKQRLGMFLTLVAGVVMAYFLFAGDRSPLPDMISDDEEFRSAPFGPSSFDRETGEPEPPSEPEVITIPPPPSPAPPVEQPAATTEFEVPPPPPPVQVDTPPPPPAAAQPAEPQEEEFPDRFRSGLIVVDRPSEQPATDPVTGEPSPVVAGQDRHSQFLATAAAVGDRTASARRIERIDALVAEGTLIPGILETAIISDLPGQIRAIVAEDVYSFDGRRVLIPTGTRLIGEYQSDITTGQRRIFVVWSRLLRDDGVSVRLNSIGADSLGRSGITGHVDRRFRERFGSAILLSVVGAGASYLTGFGGNVGIGDSDDRERAEQLARQTIAQTFSDMANQALQEHLRVPPTISVPQGERIFVYVRQDLDFSALYDDPVVEALKEIRRERNLD